MKQPKGHFTKLLIIDCETSGMCRGLNPAINIETGEKYQPVSIGLLVVDAKTFKLIDTLYLEIQHDLRYGWQPEAERIHGLSSDYLKKNGVTLEEAVIEIGNLIIKHWGPTSVINLAGHNPEFDKCFLQQIMSSHGIDLKFSYRNIDTNTLGFVVFGTYTSEELFGLLGVQRGKHNALEDARCALAVIQKTRALFDSILGE